MRPIWVGAQQPAAAPPPAKPVFTPLRGDVGTFTARGGTIGWLVTPDAVVIVDSQFPDTAQMCLDGLKAKSTRSFDALINTHHHGDHTGGNKVLKPAVARVVAHEKVPALQKMAAEKANTLADQVFADTTYATTWKQAFGKETIVLTYLGPGHTSGDSVVLFEKANLVHMGDLMFNRLHPRIDRGAGASITNWIVILEKVSKAHSADTIYIFGHAKEGFNITGSRADLTVLRDYFTALLDTTKKAIAAGTPKTELVKMTALPGFPDHGSLGTVLTLGSALDVAYDELTTK